MADDELTQAILAVQSGDMEQARVTLRAIIHQDPSNVDAWRWMAAAIEDPAKREQCWKRVLSLKPEDAQAMKALGLQARGEVSQQATSEATGETVYLRGGNFSVTSTRIAIGGKTYAVKHITSVQMVKVFCFTS